MELSPPFRQIVQLLNLWLRTVTTRWETQILSTYFDIFSTQEEFSCLDGSFISKDYVCDGENDCDGGEDENDCRRIALLFAKEDGFRLQGKNSAIRYCVH